MNPRCDRWLACALALLLALPSLAAFAPAAPESMHALPGTEPLTATGDLSSQMLDGVEKFLLRETARAAAERRKFWNRNLTSRAAFEQSVQGNRARLRRIIGLVDNRLPVRGMEYVATTTGPIEIAETPTFTVYAVRWPVLEGVEGEGLLLQPRGKPTARIVALPDADHTPEQLAGLNNGVPAEQQFARRLAEAGCQVIVPTLIDRQETWSGNPRIWQTNQPHREWVYRPAFELGRHIIGYEVQKTLAVVDWFQHLAAGEDVPIGVAGHGEGGLVAFYSAALDDRIDTALVSGYFDDRQQLWQEPIYRNVFGLLEEFGDAEIASLIAPRPLVIEYRPYPRVDGPPAAREGRRAVAAPGAIRTPALHVVRAEVARCQGFFPPGSTVLPEIHLVEEDAVAQWLKRMGVAEGRPQSLTRKRPSGDGRQQRQLLQLVDHTQHLLARSEDTRREFWSKARPSDLTQWRQSTQSYRDYLWDEVIGRLGKPSVPMNPRTRKLAETAKWTSYEVMLDLWPDVYCWGTLIVPRGIAAGERRPVVVCQHGLEGLPSDTITEDVKSPGYASYKAFAARLAERGFVTYAPHNLYRGGNRFRQLQRLANPLKKSLFSIIVAQHDRHLDWLATLPFVDPKRIGYYGLSYGGFTAMRVPPLLDRYALAINSAEFNDMARKKASVHDRYSYPFYNTYEVFEFDLANKFGYGDLAGLIAPRPFMVERGHVDGVAPDEWVAFEYAKIRRLYTFLGIGDRTEIEFFNGPHTINGVGTFAFLEKHLRWPPK